MGVDKGRLANNYPPVLVPNKALPRCGVRPRHARAQGSAGFAQKVRTMWGSRTPPRARKLVVVVWIRSGRREKPRFWAVFSMAFRHEVSR